MGKLERLWRGGSVRHLSKMAIDQRVLPGKTVQRGVPRHHGQLDGCGAGRESGRKHQGLLLRRSSLDGKTDSPCEGAPLPGFASNLMWRTGRRQVPRSLLRRGLVAHGPWGPGMARAHGCGNDDVRSEDCGSKSGESGYVRRLSANLMNGKEREQPCKGMALT